MMKLECSQAAETDIQQSRDFLFSVTVINYDQYHTFCNLIEQLSKSGSQLIGHTIVQFRDRKII